MSLTKEGQRKRVTARHGEGEEAEKMLEFLTGIFDLYEKPYPDEENTFNVDITEDLSMDDVLKKVLEVLK